MNRRDTTEVFVAYLQPISAGSGFLLRIWPGGLRNTAAGNVRGDCGACQKFDKPIWESGTNSPNLDVVQFKLDEIHLEGNGRVRSDAAKPLRLGLLRIAKTDKIRGSQMERTMKSGKTDSLRIDADAAIALVEWKSLFAKSVVENAQRIAGQSNPSGTITRSDYRRAAQQAVQKLTAAIESGDSVNGQQKAA